MAALRLASACSNAADIDVAVDQVVARIRCRLTGEADLLAVFAHDAHRPSLERLLRSLDEQLPSRHVIGCSAAGVLADGAEIEDEPGLGVLAMSMPETELRPFHVDAAHLPREDDVDAWLALAGGDPEPDGLILVVDPYTIPAVDSVVTSLDAALPDSVKIGGLASGSADGVARNALIVDGTIHERGLAGIALSGGVEIDAVVAQGCAPAGEPMFVTRCDDNLIYELDGRPAIEAISTLHASLSSDERALMHDSLFLGIAMGDDGATYETGAFLVRDLVGAAPDAGALVVAGRVQPHDVVQFHLRDRSTSDANLREALQQDLDSHSQRPPVGALLFSCLGRGKGLYGVPDHESRLVRALHGQLPLAGFFGHGEIGPVDSRTWVHGYTSALAMFREPPT